MCASEIFALLFVVVVAGVLIFSSLMLFAAVVVLVPSFFGDDAPFAEDILLKRSPFEFSLASSEKKTSALSSVFEWLSRAL